MQLRIDSEQRRMSQFFRFPLFFLSRKRIRPKAAFLQLIFYVLQKCFEEREPFHADFFRFRKPEPFFPFERIPNVFSDRVRAAIGGERVVEKMNVVDRRKARKISHAPEAVECAYVRKTVCVFERNRHFAVPRAVLFPMFEYRFDHGAHVLIVERGMSKVLKKPLPYQNPGLMVSLYIRLEKSFLNKMIRVVADPGNPGKLCSVLVFCDNGAIVCDHERVLEIVAPHAHADFLMVADDHGEKGSVFFDQMFYRHLSRIVCAVSAAVIFR